MSPLLEKNGCADLKQILVQRLQSGPYELYKEITNKRPQKIQQPLNGWLAPKPINRKGCVRLPTQYGGHELNLLYLVVYKKVYPIAGL